MHLTISYEEPQKPKVNGNTKTKDHKVFSGIDHCHFGKILKHSKSYFFFISNIHWFLPILVFFLYINDNYEH